MKNKTILIIIIILVAIAIVCILVDSKLRTSCNYNLDKTGISCTLNEKHCNGFFCKSLSTVLECDQNQGVCQDSVTCDCS